MPPTLVVGCEVDLAELGVVGPSELSRHTGLAKTTAYHTALELEAAGLVERAGDGFRLGPKLFELGSRVPGRRYLRDAALPYLEDLSQATRQTVHLAVLDGQDVLYVERLVGRRSKEVPSSVAARLPLHCTATGKCILAFGPVSALEAMSDEAVVAMTDRSITDLDELRRHLAEVRTAGVAQERGEVADGLQSLAAPIFGYAQELIGALSATGPVDDFDVDRVEPLVRLAAAGLSRRLGSG